MNQNDIILIEAGTPDFEHLKACIAYAEETGSYIRFYTELETSTPVYEVGDRVQVEFDNGMGPAEISGITDDGIRVKYGTGGKYTTTLPRSSVRTTKRRTTPAGLQVKAYEQQWSVPMHSHREKGGY